MQIIHIIVLCWTEWKLAQIQCKGFQRGKKRDKSVCVLPAGLFVSVCVLAYLMHSCAVGVTLPPLCCSWPLWPPALALVFSVFGWASAFPPLFSSSSPHLHSLLCSDWWPLTFRVEKTSYPRNTPVSHHTHTHLNICILSLCDFKWLSHLFTRHRI